MTNTLAIVLGSLILLSMIADQVWNGGAATVFIAREFTQLLEWIAFWR